MPITINHKGPRFREYKRSPVEKELQALREQVERLSAVVALQTESTPDSDRENATSTSDADIQEV